jgi:hypothetical protein
MYCCGLGTYLAVVGADMCLTTTDMRRCENVIQCTYTDLDSIAYYTPSLQIWVI